MNLEMDISRSTVDHTYPATAVGILAAPELFTGEGQSGPGRVFGNTSRGVFLQVANNRMLFISYEASRGPLTVNIPNHRRFIELKPGDPAELDPDGIYLPTARFFIRTRGMPTWSPPPTQGKRLPAHRIRQALVEIASQVGPSSGFAALLHRFSGLADSTPPVAEIQPMIQAAESLVSAGAGTQENASYLLPFLGAGRGLTPSGDDFLCGFLLAGHRWLGELRMDTFAPMVVQAAYQKTTTLSANLIEAAASGLADERLISVSDSLFQGKPDSAVAGKLALAYGSTSGIDALTGMAAAFVLVSRI
jgi:hypothetical protein